jgi:hypothetical protein
VISALIIAAVCVRFTSQGQRLSTILRSRNAPNASKSFEPQSGLRIDTAAPDFQAPTLDAGIVTLKALATRHERLLLIFIAPDCKVCCELLPEIAQWQRRVVGLALIPISRGEREATLAKLEQHGVENVLLQRNREISYLYLLRSFPSAVFVKNGRIAASLAIGADAIRALVARSLDI